MYVVTENKELMYQPDENDSQGKCAKSGWDEITIELRNKSLLARTAILCEDEPNWFGNDYAPRTKAAQYSAWNMLVEFQRLDLMANGYFIFVSPNLNRGFKFEIIGWKDVVKIFIADNGNIAWRIYRETKELLDDNNTSSNLADETMNILESDEDECNNVSQPYLNKCKRIASGIIQADAVSAHPNAGKQLREQLQSVLKPFENNKPATT